MTPSIGTLTISIDLELSWGVWDVLSSEKLRCAETEERPICAALIELFDRYEVPATWAIVAALLDQKSSHSKPGNPSCWYAPDIIESLVRAGTKHEIGSHSGRHVYFAEIDEKQALEDLTFAREVHQANALAFRSIVFPRNSVDHLLVLKQVGLATFRGPDVGWAMDVRRATAGNLAGNMIGRAANMLDMMSPLPPPPVRAVREHGLVNIAGSMLLMGRNGIRRFLASNLTRAKLAAGLSRAQRSGEVFHLWFHPSNFYYRRQEQLDTLAWFLAHATTEAGNGRLQIRTMGSYADN